MTLFKNIQEVGGDDMEQVLQEMQAKLMNKTVVIAVSTGVDSMVLWHIVKQLKNVKIIIAHVNHHQREQSNKEQQFLIELCQKEETLYYVKELTFDTHQNFQNEARIRRYGFFKKAMEKEQADYLLLAHHATDDLETIIMRLIKASSLKGYGGMEKESIYNGLHIYRPLLNISKKEIEEYAKTNQITYFQDQSNETDEYLRNRIRHYIIPYLEAENPNLYQDINEYKKHIFGANELVFEVINAFIKNNVTTNKGIISFSKEQFIKHNIYMQEQILFEILKPYQLSLNLINEILKEINNNKETIINHINDELTFVKEYGMLRFGKMNKTTPINITITGEVTLNLSENRVITFTKNKCYFKTIDCELCYNIDTLPVVIRNRKPGDKILINNKPRSLSDYLTNQKVSHLDRANLLVLTNKEDLVLHILGLNHRR